MKANRKHDDGALFILPSDAMGGAEKVLRLFATEHGKIQQNVWVYILSGKEPGLNPFAAHGSNARVIYSGTRRALQGVPGLIRFIRSRNFDLVVSSHTHVNGLTSLLRKIGLLKTRRLVARESTMIFERAFSIPKKIALRGMYRFYGRHDRIICQTEQMLASLNAHTRGRFAKQTVTIGNPISLSEISKAIKRPACLSIPNGDPTLVWCGRFHSVKRPALAVEVVRALSAQNGVRPKLVMLGSGPQYTEVESLVAGSDLGDVCTLAGYHDNPLAVFATISRGIGLLTSEIEGFPNVVLEMLAAGLDHVVVTPCCEGLGAIPGVTIARSHDVSDIVAAIKSVMNTSGDASAIAEHLASRDIAQYAKDAIG